MYAGPDAVRDQHQHLDAGDDQHAGPHHDRDPDGHYRAERHPDRAATPTATGAATPTTTGAAALSATSIGTATPGSGGGTGTGNVSGPVINVSGNGNGVVVVINYNGVATGNGVVIAGPADALPPTATPTRTPTAATLSRTPTPTAPAHPTGTPVRDNAPATAHRYANGYASYGVVVGGGTLLVRLRTPHGALTPGAPVSLTIELVAAPASRAGASRAARAVLYRATVRVRSARDGLLRARVHVSYAPRHAVAATLSVRVRTGRRCAGQPHRRHGHARALARWQRPDLLGARLLPCPGPS